MKAVLVVAAALGGFVVAAVVLALLDIYLTGHGSRALGQRPVLDVNAIGVHLSVADIIALAIAILVATVASVARESRS